MTQNQRILRAIADGPKTSWDLAQIALQYNRCVKDLRDAGLRIPAIQKRDGKKHWSVFHLVTPHKYVDFEKCKRVA